MLAESDTRRWLEDMRYHIALAERFIEAVAEADFANDLM